MTYGISFKGDDVKSTGRIFQMDGYIYLSGGNGVTVKVEASVYHKRMLAWIDSRMQLPLVFMGDDGARCTMTAPAGCGEVEVELASAGG
jgi:hypothetical protein